MQPAYIVVHLVVCNKTKSAAVARVRKPTVLLASGAEILPFKKNVKTKLEF